MEDLFDVAAEGQEPPALPLATGGADIQVFDIAITGTRELAWRALFEGFQNLRAITFSASVPAILDVAEMFDDVEITFGSERVLSRELAARTGAPLVVGTSRKSFMSRLLGGDNSIDARDDATLATVVWAVDHGARVVRVHNVRAAARPIRLLDVMEGCAA